MRRFLSSLLIAFFAFQPVVASAFFDTPAELSQGIRNDPTARTLEGQARGNAGTTYFSLWMKGAQQGMGWEDGSLDLHMTIDVDAPDQHLKMRLKTDIMLLEKTLYVRLNTIEGSVEDEMMLINLKMLQKKWIMIPLDQSGMPDLATLEEELQATASEMNNDLFSLERSPTAAGSHYSMRLTPETEQQLKDLFFGATAVHEETNFHGTVDTNMRDQFLSSKLYLSFKTDDAEFVVQGKSQRKNSPLTLTVPTQTITIDELMKYIDDMKSPLSIDDFIPHPNEGDSWSVDPFNSGRSSSFRTNAMDRYQARQAARVRRTSSSSSSRASAYSSSQASSDQGMVPATDGGLSLGDSNAPVTIIEFTDFECPFCARFANSTFPVLKSDYIYAGKVRFIIRNFPLSFHPFANEAANAVLCMQDQGSALAWKYVGILFQKQESGPALDNDVIRSWAKNIPGVRGTTFDACMDAHTHQGVITADTTAAARAGIDGTPGFWVLGPNGQAQKIMGAQPYDEFKKVIDAMLK